MEKRSFENVNEFVIRGPIVRKALNDIACNYAIKTPKQNMPNVTREGDVAYNYPEIAFYGTQREPASAFNPGDFVTVTGVIQTQKKVLKDTGREYYDQKLVGVDVAPAEKLLMREFGYDEGAYVEPVNKVRLGGVISKISTPYAGVISINIRTYVRNHVQNVQTFLFDKNVGTYMETYRVGDKVFAVGTVQTQHKQMRNGQNRFYKNVVLLAICKAEA